MAVTNLEVYKAGHDKISTSHTPGYSEYPKTIKKTRGINRQRNSSQTELHVEEVKKRGLEKRGGLNTNQLSELRNYSKRNEFFKASQK